MKIEEYSSLQRDMHRRISLIKKEEFCKKKVLDTVEEVFEKHKEDFVAERNNGDMNREEIVKNKIGSLTNESVEKTQQIYRILSDYLNFDIPLNREQMQVGIVIPLTEYQSDLIKAATLYIEKRYYASALRMVDGVLKDCDYKPGLNVVNSLKNIVAMYAKKSGTNLDQIKPDYSSFEIEKTSSTKEEEIER